MNDEKSEAIASISDAALESGFSLLTSAKEKRDMTVRDDQVDYAWLLDGIRSCREKGRRFRLVDSGKFERFQLEWLLEAGADLYTSSAVRMDFDELAGLQKAAKKGRAIVAFLQKEPLESAEEEVQENTTGLLALGCDGVYIYLSDREKPWNFKQLGRIAESCQSGGTCLVYYHHGGVLPELQELVRFPLWLHLSDRSIQDEADASAFLELLTSSTTQAELVLTIEKGLDYLVLKDMLAAGAYVFFQRAQFDYRSPFKELEKAAANRRPHFTAFYLYPSVML